VAVRVSFRLLKHELLTSRYDNSLALTRCNAEREMSDIALITPSRMGNNIMARAATACTYPN